MKTEQNIWTLTAPELMNLSRMMNLERILLPVDPFQGWLEDDMQIAFAEADESLSRRELLRLSGASVWIDPNLAGSLALLAYPQACLQLDKQAEPGPGAADVVYLCKDAWAHLREEQGEYTLSGGENFALLTANILTWMQGSGEMRRRQPVFHLPLEGSSLLQHVWRSGSSGGAADALAGCGVPPRAAEIIQRALLPGEQVRSLMGQRRQDGLQHPAGGMLCVQHTDGMSMLLIDEHKRQAVWQPWGAEAFKRWLVLFLGQLLI